MMCSRFKTIFLLFFVVLLLAAGCSQDPMQSFQIPDVPRTQELTFTDGRYVLGYYTLYLDPASGSADMVPGKQATADKQFLMLTKFKLVSQYVSFVDNPLCAQDWLAGDITFNEIITNLTTTDYYDVWLVILNGHGGTLVNPSGWATSTTFENKLPYIAFCTDDPLRVLRAGDSDSQQHVWRNPCGGQMIIVDLALVGKPAYPPNTPSEITPEPKVLSLPAWDPQTFINVKARVNDHQGDAIVDVDSNEFEISVYTPLYDDGFHGDDGAGDGLYATGDLPISDLPYGVYDIWVRAYSPGEPIKIYNKLQVKLGYIDPIWDDAVSLRVTDYYHQIGYCDLALDSTGMLHAAWVERISSSPYYMMCYYRNIKDGIVSDTVFLNDGLMVNGGVMPYLSMPQVIVGPDDEVYVFWHQWSPLGDNKLATYSRMLKDGTWGDPKRIDGDIHYPIYAPQAVCTNTGKILLVARDYRGGTYGICATQVQAGSDEWPPTVRLMNGVGQENFNLEGLESMKVGTDGFVYLAFARYDSGTDFNIYMIRIDPDLMTASAPVRVSDPDSAAAKEQHPCVWIDPNGAIGVVWDGIKTTGVDSLVYYDISTDGGQTWWTDTLVSDEVEPGSMLPIMKVYGPGQWGLTFNFNHCNYYTVTFDSGETFSPIEPIKSVGSTNMANFIIGEEYESWHVWRSNQSDTTYNVFFGHRHY